MTSTGTATTGGGTAICGGSGFGVYVSVPKNFAWLNAALTGDTTVAGQPITGGAGNKASVPTSIPWYYWGIPVICGAVLLVLLIVCCCVRNSRHAATRRHQHNVRKAAPPVKAKFVCVGCVSFAHLFVEQMIPTAQVRLAASLVASFSSFCLLQGTGQVVVQPPKTPRPAGGVSPRPPEPAPYPGNRPPVRPEYAVAPNVAYGNPALDPAFAHAPPPPPQAVNYNYPVAPQPVAPLPAVYTPAPVVYTPQYGRM